MEVNIKWRKQNGSFSYLESAEQKHKVKKKIPHK